MARAVRKKTGAIEVHGLAEVSRALKGMDKGFARELRGANKDAATTVAGDARSNAYSIGGVAAHVAPSLKASAGATSAAVSGGGPAHPAFGGAEFGSNRFKQFSPWRGNGRMAGYFVYPAIRENEEEIVRTYTEALDRLLIRAGLN